MPSTLVNDISVEEQKALNAVVAPGMVEGPHDNTSLIWR